MHRQARTRLMNCSDLLNESRIATNTAHSTYEEDTMAQSDEDSIIISEEGEHDGKTVILQRCPKHEIVFLPSEGCPECAKEKEAAGS